MKMHPTKTYTLIAAAAITLSSGQSQAAVINESSASNNTLATAQPLPDDQSNLVFASLSGSGGDVDVFSIMLEAGEILIAQTVPLREFPNEPDTELAIVNSAGVIVEESDDIGDDDSLGDALDYQAPTSGTFFIAVTGFPDGGDVGDDFGDGIFVGDHSRFGRYALNVGIIPIPEPTTAFAGLGLLGFIGLRRRRA